MFKKLLEVNEEVKELQGSIKAKKEQFELSIIEEKNRLDDLLDLEQKLKNEVLEIFKTNNESSVTLDNMTIAKSYKKTIQIDDSNLLYASIVYNQDKIKAMGIDADSFIKENFEEKIDIKNKSAVTELINNYNKLEGKLLNGAVENKTEFITIRKAT